MKYFIKSRNALLSLINNNLLLLNIKPYMLDYFEFDLCKNIRIKDKKNNITTVKFKKNKDGKTILDFITKNKLFTYNQLNNTKINDYHANNCDISIIPESIGINKLNFYVPLMNNIIDNSL